MNITIDQSADISALTIEARALCDSAGSQAAATKRTSYEACKDALLCGEKLNQIKAILKEKQALHKQSKEGPRPTRWQEYLETEWGIKANRETGSTVYTGGEYHAKTLSNYMRVAAKQKAATVSTNVQSMDLATMYRAVGILEPRVGKDKDGVELSDTQKLVAQLRRAINVVSKAHEMMEMREDYMCWDSAIGMPQWVLALRHMTDTIEFE